jgi:homoserine dehydrogenase
MEDAIMNIAVLGYGTVGSGVVEVLTENQDSIDVKAGKEIRIKYILDLRDFPGDPHEDKIVHDFKKISEDDSVQIVVETMGGIHPAFEFVKECLEKGKSVCTSNKELVAKHGAQLLSIAKEKKVNFLFEASVGGGIPIIRPLNQSLTADKILEISGILNGTTNYILTKMADEGLDFDTVLKDAQEKGYAERNPEADVEGYDACRKIAILTSLAYGRQVDYEDIYTEGITKITDVDIKYAKAMGVSIKIFGMSKMTEDGVIAMVAPFMIDKAHPLFPVNDVFNGIFVKGNMLGDAMFYGRGAGKLPTASAVAADVVDAAKHEGVTIMTIWEEEKLELAPIDTAKFSRFVRVKDGFNIAGTFGNVKVLDPQVDGEMAFLTRPMSEADYKKIAAETDGILSMIRLDFKGN